MLETIRAYAHEQLVASDNETRLREAHLRHIVELGEQAWDARTEIEEDRLLQKLRPEAANIRVALAWSLEPESVEGVRLTGSLDF